MKPSPLHRTLLALIPLGVLVTLLAFDIAIFGADSILGASQVVLLVASGICVWLAMWLYDTPWKDFEAAIARNFGDIAPSVLILFLIGAISGTWTMSGVVPAFISYGIGLISPKVFLLTACLLCAVVSVMTGSSWTTIATVGVALLGIGRAEGFSDALTAGAIISGAYFGDKISPLSDTTVLASSVNGVPLFSHIRYMLFTTVPSFVITLVIFTVLGLTHTGTPDAEMEVYSSVLGSHFHLTPWLLLVPAFTVWMIWKRQPAIMVLALSALVAAIAAVVFQPDIVRGIGSAVTQGSDVKLRFTGTVRMVYDSLSLDTGVPEVNQLLATRGMLGMLNTVFLILCAMCFGACMKASGMIADLSRILAPLTRTRTGLVGSTVVTGTALNGIVSDQYLAILLTSNIYKDSFDKQGYEPRLLSRSVEDSATVTSPLFPWSSCGMTQATILSVPTLAYAPFCFFNILSPLISILIAATGWKIVRPKAAPATRDRSACGG
ncbi:MAG: sodium:proton antiporter [Bacteroidales bacterium]|nr:sodium:proton antiporter [Bacteroidales bacterium]